MDEIELEEVNAAIRQHWQTADLTLAIVTGAGDAIADALASNAPTPITNTNAMPDAVRAEDREISAWPLAIERSAIERWPVASLFD
jgi:hypothetical protein